jgi:predicted lipid-binding transport protein (Tim44 family)
MRRHTTLIAATIAGGVVLALTVGGCTAESKGSASTAALDKAGPAVSAAPAAGRVVEAAPSPAAPPNSAPAAAGAGSSGRIAPADQPLLAGRDVIYTADITVRATNIDDAVKQVENAASTYHGVVYAEQVDLTSKDPSNPGNASATITLKVPPENLQQTLDAVGKVGTEISRTVGSDDVTEKVVDVNARIDAARTSIARLTELLNHQGTVSDLLNVENQLSQRDSDLESLEQQQKSLAAQTKSATITVHLQAAPPVIEATKTKQTHTFGFVRGLRGGWHAYTNTVAAIATGIGAVLPFLIVLAVVGVALIIGRRKLRGRRPQES